MNAKDWNRSKTTKLQPEKNDQTQNREKKLEAKKFLYTIPQARTSNSTIFTIFPGPLIEKIPQITQARAAAADLNLLDYEIPLAEHTDGGLGARASSHDSIKKIGRAHV